MAKRFLVVSEGEHPEIEILRFIFERLGFVFNECDKDLDFSTSFKAYFASSYLRGVNSGQDRSVYFVHLKNPKVKKLLKDIMEEGENAKALGDIVSGDPYFFQASFLLHDVDHYYTESLQEIYKLYNVPEKGLLTLSIPCFEAICEDRPDEARQYEKPTKYQDELYRFHKTNHIDYFKLHAKELLLLHLEKNSKRFGQVSFMDHPDALNNELAHFFHIEDDLLVYSYFVSLAYVVVGVVSGISLDDDNVKKLADIIKERF